MGVPGEGAGGKELANNGALPSGDAPDRKQTAFPCGSPEGKPKCCWSQTEMFLIPTASDW